MTGKTLLRTPVLISLGGESKCFPSKSILKRQKLHILERTKEIIFIHMAHNCVCNNS